MRSLILLVIGLFFGTGIGFILNMPQTAHDHAGHSDMAHDASAMHAWEGPAPTLNIYATNFEKSRDIDLQIVTSNFEWAPERVNGQSFPKMGHAHVYVNGEKVLRAYGEWLQIPNVPEGATIRVVLNANDHSAWAINGQPIAAEITVP